MTSQEEGITFEVDRLSASSASRIEVSGRWYGVRGRRFVRPTLTLTLAGADSEQRLLADLEHKPWAAQDGDPWLAAFPFDGEFESAERIELAVAPDITVELAGGSGPRVNTGRAADLLPAGSTRSRLVRDDPARPRPRASRSPEVVRLRERLALAESVVTRERTRRQAAEEAVENERQSARTLQAEVGRLRAELELAGAVQRELDTASAGLDDLRGQVRELGRERDQIAAQRDQIAAQRDQAQRELASERAELGRLAGQLADAEAAVRRLTRAGSGGRVSEGQPRAPVSATSPDKAPAGAPSDRPLNPSLRGPNWLGRGIALVVFVLVVVAVIVVINSTIT